MIVLGSSVDPNRLQLPFWGNPDVLDVCRGINEQPLSDRSSKATRSDQILVAIQVVRFHRLECFAQAPFSSTLALNVHALALAVVFFFSPCSSFPRPFARQSAFRCPFFLQFKHSTFPLSL